MKKVKFFYEVIEREVVVYVLVNGIEYEIDECFYVRGVMIFEWKVIFNEMEEKRFGMKINFVKGYLRKKYFFEVELKEIEFRECKVCGMLLSGEVCLFCCFWRLEKLIDFRVEK